MSKLFMLDLLAKLQQQSQPRFCEMTGSHCSTSASEALSGTNQHPDEDSAPNPKPYATEVMGLTWQPGQPFISVRLSRPRIPLMPRTPMAVQKCSIGRNATAVRCKTRLGKESFAFFYLSAQGAGTDNRGSEQPGPAGVQHSHLSLQAYFQ